MTASYRADAVKNNASTGRRIGCLTGVVQTVVSSIGVSADSRALRRTVGTTAWAVLEDVVLDAEANEVGVLVAATNVRRLAMHLGVSKDTAARALTRLLDAGLVRRVVCGRGERGAFSCAAYTVNVGQLVGITLDDPTTEPSPRTDRPRPAKVTSRPTTHAQSTLFDDPVTDAR